MTNKNILNTIASYAQLNVEDFSDINFTLDGDFCEVLFNCQLMHYHCYVDISSCEVAGFLFEPVAQVTALGSKYAA